MANQSALYEKFVSISDERFEKINKEVCLCVKGNLNFKDEGCVLDREKIYEHLFFHFIGEELIASVFLFGVIDGQLARNHKEALAFILFHTETDPKTADLLQLLLT